MRHSQPSPRSAPAMFSNPSPPCWLPPVWSRNAPHFLPLPVQSPVRPHCYHCRNSLVPLFLKGSLGDVTLLTYPPDAVLCRWEKTLGVATVACKPGATRFEEPDASMMWQD